MCGCGTDDDERGPFPEKNNKKWRCCCNSCHVMTGAKIIAWLHLATAIMGVLLLVGHHYGTEYINKDLERIQQKLKENPEARDKSAERWDAMKKYFELKPEWKEKIYSVGGMFLAFDVALYVMLMIGLYKKKRCLLWPYLICGLISAFCLIATIIGFIIQLWWWYVVLKAYKYLGARDNYFKNYAQAPVHATAPPEDYVNTSAPPPYEPDKPLLYPSVDGRHCEKC